MKSQLVACVTFDQKVDFRFKSTEGFRQKLMDINEICDMNAYTMYDLLEQYKNAGKITFNKTETQMIGKCEEENKN